MFRIIKHGNDSQLGPVTCENCGCEFTYSFVDAMRQVDLEKRAKIEFTHCPECFNQIILKEEALPEPEETVDSAEEER